MINNKIYKNILFYINQKNMYTADQKLCQKKVSRVLISGVYLLQRRDLNNKKKGAK